MSCQSSVGPSDQSWFVPDSRKQEQTVVSDSVCYAPLRVRAPVLGAPSRRIMRPKRPAEQGVFWEKFCVEIFGTFFLMGVGVYVGVCARIRTHTHTVRRDGVLDVSPGVGTRHLKGPKNLDGPNLRIRVFVDVYKVHMCIYMLLGCMRSGLIQAVFCLQHIFPFGKATI